MADLANLISGLVGTTTPETTGQINNDTLQGQSIQQNAITLQYQQQQRAAQIAALQARQGAISDYLSTSLDDPNRAVKFNKLMTLAPDLHESAKQGYDSMTTEAQKQHLNDSSSMLGYVQSGDYKGALDHINNIITADKGAGKDTSQDEEYANVLIKAIRNDPDAKAQALNLAQLHTAAILGPEKFAENYPQLAKLPTDVANTEATTAKTNAETGILIPSEAYKNYADANNSNASATKTTNESNSVEADKTDVIDPETGKPYLYSKRTGQFVGNNDDAGVTQSLSYAVDKILPTEANSATAKNPNSSATGAGQFINSTWLEQVKSNYPDLTKGKTDKQILEMRSDPKLSRAIAINYAEQNANKLQDAGNEVNTTTLAIAHKLGPEDANRVLKADESTPLNKLLSNKVLVANPQLAKQTVGQYISGIANQVGTAPINISPNPSATGKDALEQLSPARRARVEAYVNGTASIVGRFGNIDDKNPDVQLALKVDPTLASSPNRYAAMKSLSDDGSPVHTVITAANTVLPHLADLVKIKHEQGATSNYLGNAIGSVASGAFQGVIPGIGNRANNNAAFAVANKTYSTERAKLLQGKAPGEKEIGEALKDIGMDQNLDQAKAAATESLNAMLAKVNAVKEQTEGLVGHNLPEDMFIKPDVQKKVFETQRLLGQASAPTRGDIAHLLVDPTLAAHFDEQFGKYSANYYLRGHH